MRATLWVLSQDVDMDLY